MMENQENQENNQQVETKASSDASHETSASEPKQEAKQEVKESPEIKLPTPEEMGIFPKDEGEKGESEGKPDKSDEKPTEPPKFTEIEKIAIKKGWIPQEEFRGDPGEWRDARAYIDRGELLDTISSRNKDYKGLLKTNEHQVELIRKMSARLDEREQRDSQKEHSNLILARNQAIETGDVATVNLIDQKIDEIRKAEIQIQAQQSPDPVLVQFQQDNSNWFNQATPENKMMHDYAVMTDNWLMQQYPSLTISERLEQVKKTVEKTYPQRFKPKEAVKSAVQDYRPDFPTVENSKPVPKKKRDITFNDLDEQSKRVVSNFCRYDKTISRDQYAKELFRIGSVVNK